MRRSRIVVQALATALFALYFFAWRFTAAAALRLRSAVGFS